MGAFRELQADLAPAFLQGPYGAAYESALGDAKDALAERAKRAVKERFIRNCSPEAVAQIAAERLIERGPGEAMEHFRARLAAAWETWSFAGTAFGLLTAMAAGGYTNAYLEIVNGKQYSLDAGGALVVTNRPPWFITADTSYWSRFAVVFSPPPDVVAGQPDSSDAAATLRRIIKLWKPAHARCSRIVIVNSGSVWGFPPGEAWGTCWGGAWGGGAITEWTGV